jgi:hypothetical protein
MGLGVSRAAAAAQVEALFFKQQLMTMVQAMQGVAFEVLVTVMVVTVVQWCVNSRRAPVCVRVCV